MGEAISGADLLAATQAFRARIVSQREAIETSRRLPEELARDLAQAGLFRIFLPAAYGGLDMTPTDGIAVFEELARADASVAWCAWNGNTHWTAAQLSPEAAHAIHDDPDVITANSTRPSGQAHVVDNGYRVTGRWSLVSGCELASWMVRWAVVHEVGTTCWTPSGGPEIRFMLLPASQCEIIDTWTVGGLRGTGSDDVAVQDVFVPAAFGSGSSIPMCWPSHAIAFRRFAVSSPGSARWRWASPAPRSENSQRDSGLQTPGAHDPDASRYAGRAGPSVAGRGAGSVGTAFSVRQRRDQVWTRTSGDGRGDDGGPGAGTAGRISCRQQRGAGC